MFMQASSFTCNSQDGNAKLRQRLAVESPVKTKEVYPPTSEKASHNNLKFEDPGSTKRLNVDEVELPEAAGRTEANLLSTPPLWIWTCGVLGQRITMITMPMPKELKQLFLWVPCFIYGIIVIYPQDPILILKAPISQRWIATRTWPGACLGLWVYLKVFCVT